MIEGLGILLTKMTAPPPAPPPALDGIMGAPQPGVVPYKNTCTYIVQNE